MKKEEPHRMKDEEPHINIVFNQYTKCSNNVAILKGIVAQLVEINGLTASIICGEIEVTCPANSFTILDEPGSVSKIV